MKYAVHYADLDSNEMIGDDEAIIRDVRRTLSSQRFVVRKDDENVENTTVFVEILDSDMDDDLREHLDALPHWEPVDFISKMQVIMPPVDDSDEEPGLFKQMTMSREELDELEAQKRAREQMESREEQGDEMGLGGAPPEMPPGGAQPHAMAPPSLAAEQLASEARAIDREREKLERQKIRDQIQREERARMERDDIRQQNSAAHDWERQKYLREREYEGLKERVGPPATELEGDDTDRRGSRDSSAPSNDYGLEDGIEEDDADRRDSRDSSAPSDDYGLEEIAEEDDADRRGSRDSSTPRDDYGLEEGIEEDDLTEEDDIDDDLPAREELEDGEREKSSTAGDDWSNLAETSSLDTQMSEMRSSSGRSGNSNRKRTDSEGWTEKKDGLDDPDLADEEEFDDSEDLIDDEFAEDEPMGDEEMTDYEFCQKMLREGVRYHQMTEEEKARFNRGLAEHKDGFAKGGQFGVSTRDMKVAKTLSAEKNFSKRNQNVDKGSMVNTIFGRPGADIGRRGRRHGI